jgi:hypothetical protein
MPVELNQWLQGIEDENVWPDADDRLSRKSPGVTLNNLVVTAYTSCGNCGYRFPPVLKRRVGHKDGYKWC